MFIPPKVFHSLRELDVVYSAQLQHFCRVVDTDDDWLFDLSILTDIVENILSELERIKNEYS